MVEIRKKNNKRLWKQKINRIGRGENDMKRYIALLRGINVSGKNKMVVKNGQFKYK